jgi:hypothetical protein
MTDKTPQVTKSTANNIKDEGDEVEEGTSMVDIHLLMNKIWDDCHLECYLDSEQRKRWRCLWCNENYAGWHATKAVIHLAKAPKMDIAPCKGILPDEEAKQYRSLFERCMQT